MYTNAKRLIFWINLHLDEKKKKNGCFNRFLCVNNPRLSLKRCRFLIGKSLLHHAHTKSVNKLYRVTASDLLSNLLFQLEGLEESESFNSIDLISKWFQIEVCPFVRSESEWSIFEFNRIDQTHRPIFGWSVSISLVLSLSLCRFVVDRSAPLNQQ